MQQKSMGKLIADLSKVGFVKICEPSKVLTPEMEENMALHFEETHFMVALLESQGNPVGIADGWGKTLSESLTNCVKDYNEYILRNECIALHENRAEDQD